MTDDLENSHDRPEPTHDATAEPTTPPATGPPSWQPLTPFSAGPSAPRSRRRWVMVLAASAVVLVVGGGVGTAMVLSHRADAAAQHKKDEAAQAAAAKEQKQAEQQAADEAAARAEKERQEAAELARLTEIYDSCTAELRPLTRALSNVDARLDVGLSQSDLSDMVGRASIAYSRINVHALGTGLCLTAGASLEGAFNSYSTTVSDWNDCIFDYYCDVDTILPGMQSKWASASRSIDRAVRAMGRLDPTSPQFGHGSGDNA